MTYLALIASVLVGVLIVFSLKPSNKTAQLLLSFSGAYLLSITILQLLPEVYQVKGLNVGLFILMGLLLQLILDFFSKGAEHGHIHIQQSQTFPWALFISLSIHSFMEGIPLAHNHQHNHLLWAIVVHKIPIAIILATFFVNSNFSKKTSVIFLFLFAFMSPLGSFAGESVQFLTITVPRVSFILMAVLPI